MLPRPLLQLPGRILIQKSTTEISGNNTGVCVTATADAQYKCPAFVLMFEPGANPRSEDGSGGTARGWSLCVALRQLALPFRSLTLSSFLLPCSWQPERNPEFNGAPPHPILSSVPFICRPPQLIFRAQTLHLQHHHCRHLFLFLFCRCYF